MVNDQAKLKDFFSLFDVEASKVTSRAQKVTKIVGKPTTSVSTVTKELQEKNKHFEHELKSDNYDQTMQKSRSHSRKRKTKKKLSEIENKQPKVTLGEVKDGNPDAKDTSSIRQNAHEIVCSTKPEKKQSKTGFAKVKGEKPANMETRATRQNTDEVFLKTKPEEKHLNFASAKANVENSAVEDAACQVTPKPRIELRPESTKPNYLLSMKSLPVKKRKFNLPQLEATYSPVPQVSAESRPKIDGRDESTMHGDHSTVKSAKAMKRTLNLPQPKAGYCPQADLNAASSSKSSSPKTEFISDTTMPDNRSTVKSIPPKKLKINLPQPSAEYCPVANISAASKPKSELRSDTTMHKKRSTVRSVPPKKLKINLPQPKATYRPGPGASRTLDNCITVETTPATKLKLDLPQAKLTYCASPTEPEDESPAQGKSVNAKSIPAAKPMLNLPQIKPTYCPVSHHNTMSSSVKPKKIELTDNQVAELHSKRRTNKMLVYSGCCGGVIPKMISLRDQCMNALMNNIDAIDSFQGAKFELVQPILKKCTTKQLSRLENANPYLMSDTGSLWVLHCTRDFHGEVPCEMETWREMYLRLSKERKEKLESVTLRISEKEAKKKPLEKKAKLAYVGANAKAHRHFRKAQEDSETAARSLSRSSSASALKRDIIESRMPARSISASHITANKDKNRQVVKQAKKTNVAPMMAKTLKSIGISRFRR